nr:hypothetical protein Iba_chr15bCG11010 [Ipomoea batatas]
MSMVARYRTGTRPHEGKFNVTWQCAVGEVEDFTSRLYRFIASSVRIFKEKKVHLSVRSFNSLRDFRPPANSQKQKVLAFRILQGTTLHITKEGFPSAFYGRASASSSGVASLSGVASSFSSDVSSSTTLPTPSLAAPPHPWCRLLIHGVTSSSDVASSSELSPPHPWLDSATLANWGVGGWWHSNWASSTNPDYKQTSGLRSQTVTRYT